MKDLVLLVADKNAHFALKGALPRHNALEIRPISFEFRVHPGSDGGTRVTGPEILARERNRFAHCLLMLDMEGSGTEHSAAVDLEAELDARLRPHWGERSKAIVIEPEVDVWAWGTDNALEPLIGWNQGIGLRHWLRSNGFEFSENNKPVRPKEALQSALRVTEVPRSSSLYQSIAEKISLRGCADPAFVRLRRQLQRWFPVSTA